MGGLGSNRWDGVQTKRRVESCMTLAVPRTRRAPQVLSSDCGVWRWPKYGFSVTYRMHRHSPDLAMRLHYWGVVQHVQLTATRPRYGGLRWWFECPGCDRRASKLYLPPRKNLFMCRVCHDLSYESAQGSGAFHYRLFKADARKLGCSSRVIREAVRREYGGHLVADLAGKPEVNE